jgi:hypothetical protein
MGRGLRPGSDEVGMQVAGCLTAGGLRYLYEDLVAE